MKRALKIIPIFAVCCCSLLCGCVPACGGIGWYTDAEKLRGQADGLSQYLEAADNYCIFASEYEWVNSVGSDEPLKNVFCRSTYLFTGDSVCYYELNSKTGAAAHYSDGVLKNFYDGKETVTNGLTYASGWGQRLIQAMRGELGKPVQNDQRGYHYLFFDYDFVSYSNSTEVSVDGQEFTGFSADFHVYNESPEYRSYSLKLFNDSLTYELAENVSGLTAEDIKREYESFKGSGRL